jgi:hypothetical protein
MLRSRLTRPLQQRRRPHRRATDGPAQQSGGESAESRERERKAVGDLARARTAGGPLDSACYTCGCGFVFNAAVSTSVACPHCGARQAW